MKVMVIGGGGREHALAWKLAQSDQVDTVLVAPGNAGTALEPGVINVAVVADDLDGLVNLAKAEHVALTVVGPEAPLAAGVVDRFESAGLRCFGPSAAAARLESSKAFCKDFMRTHAIPTARYKVVKSLPEGLAFADELGYPVVIKADGLAAGKGVVIAEDADTAALTLTDMLSGRTFGAAGRRVVVEAFLTGEEVSFMVLAAGQQAVPLASSQDHKRRDEGDLGPNTGGMGAYSPAPAMTAALEAQVMREVIEPTLAGLAAQGAPFTGFLYAGLMLTEQGPRVLEFNVRLGDPETQPLLMRLRSDLLDLMTAALDGELAAYAAARPVEWDPRTAVGVVLAAGGYPNDYARGRPIDGLDQAFPDTTKVFHAGTALDGDRVVSQGGRVLCVTALGEDARQAQQAAYASLDTITLEDGFYRRDIAQRAIDRGA